MAEIMLACGHAANAQVKNNGATEYIPGCAICGNTTQVTAPDLTGRTAICNGHKFGKPTPIPSQMTLAFFEYRPSQEHDAYYCGCYGWD